MSLKKILIVDDEEQVRELIAATLKAHDYAVLEAENGEAAIEKTKSERPNLIIMDIMMPGAIDGLEAVRRIRKLPKISATPVILLTGKPPDKQASGQEEIHVLEYFMKPFSPLDLLRKVEETLG